MKELGRGGGMERQETALAQSLITWTKQTKQLSDTANNNNEIMGKWKRKGELQKKFKWIN